MFKQAEPCMLSLEPVILSHACSADDNTPLILIALLVYSYSIPLTCIYKCTHFGLGEIPKINLFNYGYRYNLASGTSEKIQLGALLGAFQIVRDIVTAQS